MPPNPGKGQADLATLQLRVEELSAQHDFDRRLLEALRAERVNARDQGSILDRRVRALSDDVSRLQDEIDGARAEAQDLTTERDDAIAREDRAVARAAKLSVQVDAVTQARDELARSIGKLERRIRVRDERIAELERDLARAVAAVNDQAALVEQLADGEKHLDRAATQLAERDAELAELQRRLADADTERLRLAEQAQWLTDASATIAAERDTLAERFASADATVADLRAHAEELRAMVDAERVVAAETLEVLHNEQQRREALLVDLTRTRDVLQARTAQLEAVFASRWFRVARSSWQARSRRPPLASILLVALALYIFGAVVLAAQGGGAVVAAFLGAAILVISAGAYAVVVPALLDRRAPRLAGEGTFSQLLVDTSSPVIEGVSADVRVVSASALPVAAPRRLSDLRVAGVLDEMSASSFAPECALDTSFRADDWRNHLEAQPPDLLLVESAWSGNGGGWQYEIGTYPHPSYAGLPRLREVLGWCRTRGIPTVFWNKEDPVHFDRFKEAAALFDHIFTTDADCIGRYRELGGERVRSVGALQFAAQPRLHHPVSGEPRQRAPVFAGTYYRDRHEGRRGSLEMILDAARPHGLVIYDRRFGTDGEQYGFPERFARHIRGRLDYVDMVEEYRRHRVFVNVNSVAGSPTMFSRRVFELLACGTAVISTESVGIEATFGDIVHVVDTPQEADDAFERLLDDDAYFEGVTARGLRLVMAQHTYRERLAQVAREAGIAVAQDPHVEVAALAVADDAAGLVAIAETLVTQSSEPQEVLLGVSADVAVEAALDRLAARFPVERVRVVRQEITQQRSERLRHLAHETRCDWVLPVTEFVEYPGDHLRDLATCLRFVDADVIGVAAPGALTHSFGRGTTSHAALVRAFVVRRYGWPEASQAHDEWFRAGVRFYTAGRDRAEVPDPQARRSGRLAD